MALSYRPSATVIDMLKFGWGAQGRGTPVVRGRAHCSPRCPTDAEASTRTGFIDSADLVAATCQHPDRRSRNDDDRPAEPGKGRSDRRAAGLTDGSICVNQIVRRCARTRFSRYPIANRAFRSRLY